MRQSRGYGVAAEVEKAEDNPAMIFCFGLVQSSNNGLVDDLIYYFINDRSPAKAIVPDV